MIPVAEIVHEDTEEIICPWCGYEFQDSWEFEENGEHECYGCGKSFKFSRIIDVTYDTERIEP